MKTIAVTNRKGGVGKSTMAVHIAAGLATLGYRVGLVDTDSQGHAGLMLNMPESNGLFDLLVDKRPLNDVIQAVNPAQYSTPERPAQGALFLLPSSDQTYKIPYELDAGEVFVFLEAMEEFDAVCGLDVVIIDTNPTMSMLDGVVYMATDGFIYVTECERLSFDGVERAITQMLRFGKSRKRFLDRENEVVGIIPNKLKANTILHRHNVSDLGKVYGDLVWTPVTHRIAWAEGANLNEPVFIYAPDGQEARDAWYLVRQTEKALERWGLKTG